MSRLRYEKATIQDARKREDFIIELKFLGEGWSDLILFKTYNAKDAYVMGRIMEACGVRNVVNIIDHEVELALFNQAIIAVSSNDDDDDEFYPMPSSELYYYTYEQLEYTKEELEEIYS